MRIGLVTDSTCDLSPDIISKYNIEIVPLSIHFSEEEVYLDRVEIESGEFFRRLEEGNEMPTTSQPSIGRFLDKYESLTDKYDIIISIHLSSKLSGTIKSATMAAKQCEDVDVRVVDSLSASHGLGFLVLLAARLIEDGKSVDEILEWLDKAKEKITIYFTLNDLTYLEKGGRIGKAQALIGNILNFYPILSIPGGNGEILPQEKVRGKKKIVKKLIQLAEKELKDQNSAWLGFIHGSQLKHFNIFKEKMLERTQEGLLDNYVAHENYISPVLGSHVGPSIYGIVILKGDILPK